MYKLIIGLLMVALGSVAQADWMDSASKVLTSSKTPSASEPAAADFSAGLVPALTGSLGVSSEQASGGLGALFGLAKNNVSSKDFATLSNVVPGMASLLSAAPEVGGGGGLLGSVDKYGKALSGAKQVYEQFSALGLDQSKIPQYMSVTTSYLQSEGGQAAVDIFKDGVRSLLTSVLRTLWPLTTSEFPRVGTS